VPLANGGVPLFLEAIQRVLEMTQRILGVDPGVHGGLAVIELNDGAAPQLIDAIDIPTVGTGAKERVDVLALRAWFKCTIPIAPESSAARRCQSRAHRQDSNTAGHVALSKPSSPAVKSRSSSSSRRSGSGPAISGVETRRALVSSRCRCSPLSTRCSHGNGITNALTPHWLRCT
jgi:hypothetical protein